MPLELMHPLPKPVVIFPFLAIEAEKPIYHIGAFGGCARLVIDALNDQNRKELTWEYHRRIPHSEELRKLYHTHGKQRDSFDDIAARLQSTGMNGLRNGLTVDENRELVSTSSTVRMIELILRGLSGLEPGDNDKAGDGET